jgi:hypothetical protein
MAGRGADEGWRKLAGSGVQEGLVRARKHGPGDRKATRGAPEGDAPLGIQVCANCAGLFAMARPAERRAEVDRAFRRSTPSRLDKRKREGPCIDRRRLARGNDQTHPQFKPEILHVAKGQDREAEVRAARCRAGS